MRKQNLTFSAGVPLPFGATASGGGVNFAFFARHATAAGIVLFRDGHELASLSLDPERNRTGDVWHLFVEGVGPGDAYSLRVDGPFDPHGGGHYYDPRRLLIDPYARALAGGERWGEGGGSLASFQRHCLIIDDGFDWEGDRPLRIPLENTIIYEMHVRGFTAHPSAGVRHPGTFRGVIEKIPHLVELGITAVELMPVSEFNENEIPRRDPATGKPLRNLWGYSPVSFFAPKASYAADNQNGRQVREFKEMVKALHRAGIEVILDVVFNHTAEGGGDGPVLSFRGLDNSVYYLLDPTSREFLNFSGCGNTMNCNHPLVRQFIIDCLRYWVIEMHVDGFRFDLASILGRDRQGQVLSNPPMVEKIAEDPILAHTKIIAEAWDAAGVYQVGSFSASDRWAEWNGRYRDDVRLFLCGGGGAGALATRVAGSSDLYQASGRLPVNSINFVTSHDGFTLHDLVAYDRKHNEANGEGGRDGSDHNISWNSGVEGPTRNRRVVGLRQRRIRSFAVILMLSQGVPMLVAGDEFGRSQGGNNNAYCQDNETGWVDWRLVDRNRGLLRFFRLLIALRLRHPVFRRRQFFDTAGGEPEILWQSAEGRPDWSGECRTLAFLLSGQRHGVRHDDDFFVMVSGERRSRNFVVPEPPAGRRWRKIIDTAAPPPDDIAEAGEGGIITGRRLAVASMAVVVLASTP
ncbi:MAG: glycogen debranching protein GlgX [Thermodesulfobacteriota bacterium]